MTINHWLLTAGVFAHAGIALAVNATAPGQGNPWLAGAPNGTHAGLTNEDVAPAQSPALVTGLVLSPGQIVTFTNVAGIAGNGPSETNGPEGHGLTTHGGGAEHGIADLNAPIASFVGVFLDNNVPSGPAPVGLDFDTPASRDYLSLSPLLAQPFFIGDGLTSGSVQQQVIVPAGATRLFLGIMDGGGWYNNVGSFTANVLPEPSTVGLLLLGGLVIRRSKRLSW